MAHVLASGRYATDLLLRAPEAVAILGDDAELDPRSRPALRAEMMAAVRGTRTTPRPRWPRSARCAAASCSAPPPPTLARASPDPPRPALAATGEALTERHPGVAAGGAGGGAAQGLAPSCAARCRPGSR